MRSATGRDGSRWGLLLAGWALLAGAGCESSVAATPEAAAAKVKAWVPSGVKGDLVPEEVRCSSSDSAHFLCEVDAKGGGTMKVRAVATAGDWSMDLAEPVIVASRLEAFIRDYDEKVGVAIMPACGDRVRLAVQGDTFKCLVRDMAGKEVSAMEVTVTDAKTSSVSLKRLTSLVDRDELQTKIAEWLGTEDISGAVACPPPRRHYSVPETSFLCTVEGLDRKVQVKIADYRAKAAWGWAPEG